MDVIGRDKLESLAQRHPEVRGHCAAWLLEVEAARWRTPNDLKQSFASASLLGEGRVVFNLKGNRYRLLVRVAYHTGIVIVLRAGTHAEYDRWQL